MIDRVRRRVEAGIILVEQRFDYRVDSLIEATSMLDLLVEQERTKEKVKHEENRKRNPQKKRPPGVFARDVPAASSVAMPARDIGTGEAASSVASNRDSRAVEGERRGCGITADAAYDRAVRDCQDSGSVQ
jgi:hypothetical protein